MRTNQSGRLRWPQGAALGAASGTVTRRKVLRVWVNSLVYTVSRSLIWLSKSLEELQQRRSRALTVPPFDLVESWFNQITPSYVQQYCPLTHGRECMEILGNIGGDRSLVRLVHAANVFDLEQSLTGVVSRTEV
jgi:hypothetical protein